MSNISDAALLFTAPCVNLRRWLAGTFLSLIVLCLVTALFLTLRHSHDPNDFCGIETENVFGDVTLEIKLVGE